MIENNENKDICAKCGGRCCKNMGCHYSPRDFKKVTYSKIKQLIETGNVSIDWWVGDVGNGCRSKTYYLRARNVDADIVDPSYGGVCKLLGENGCQLSFEDRPMGGKMLEPYVDNQCVVKYSKYESSKEWYKYQDILDKLVEEYKIECVLSLNDIKMFSSAMV